jgi:hypothetical protein
MKRFTEIGLCLLLLAMLAAVYTYLGWRVAAFAGGLSSVWFCIAMVLLTRPPGFPEFVSERPGSDEQYVVRRDLSFQLSWLDRLRLSLGVANGCCLLVWITLVLLA